MYASFFLSFSNFIFCHSEMLQNYRGYSFFSEGNQAEKMAYKYKPIKDEILGSDSEG